MMQAYILFVQDYVAIFEPEIEYIEEWQGELRLESVRGDGWFVPPGLDAVTFTRLFNEYVMLLKDEL